MNLGWFLRMARWARNPPSMRAVRGLLLVIAVCLALVGIEALGLWPDWATTGGGGRAMRP
ncbi:MAG: hypothetical protein ACK4TB_16955 [Gemmobacter sp.]